MFIRNFIGGLAFGKLFNDRPHFVFDGHLYDVKGNVDLRLYEQGVDSIINGCDSKLRVGSLLNKEKMKEIEYDTLEEVEPPVKRPSSKSEIYCFDDEFIFFIERDSCRHALYCFNYKNSISTVILEAGALDYYDENIIVQRKVNELLGYDWEGRNIWRYAIGRTSATYRPNLMFNDIGEGLLFNAGEFRDKSGAIVCLNKMTGEPIWKRTFERRVDDSFLVDGKIYLALANSMLILNQDDGRTNLEFSADISESELTTLWTDGRLLYLIATKSNQLIAYSQDGKLIKRYMIPDHPRLKHGTKFFHHNNINYLGLTRGSQILAGVEGGLLTWTAEDVLSGKELEIEEKPFIINMIIKENDGSQSYYVNIPCENIHDVLRFGEIEARKVAALHGKQMDDNSETRNKKFNGQIKLIIDPAVGEANRVYLDMLAKRCTFFAKVMDIKSGDGKKPIEVRWAFSNEL